MDKRINILAFDTDSTQITGVCLENGKYVGYFRVVPEVRDPNDRFLRLMDGFKKFIVSIIEPGSLIAIESPIYIQNPLTTIKLSEVVGGCRALLLDFDCVEVGNRTWKKAVLGNGNASKEDIKKFVLEKYPEIGFDCPQHVYDGTAIAIWRSMNVK